MAQITLPGFVKTGFRTFPYDRILLQEHVDQRSKSSDPNWAKNKLISPKSVRSYSRTQISGYAYSHLIGSAVAIPKSNSADITNSSWDFYISDNRLSFGFITSALAKYRPQLLNEANALLQDRLSGTKLDGLVELGEAGKTFSMFNDRVKNTARFINNFSFNKRGLYNRARQFLHERSTDRLSSSGRSRSAGGALSTSKQRASLIDEMTDAYLEFTFGWTPLEASIQDGLEIIHDSFNKRPPRQKVSAHASSDVFPDEVFTNQSMPFGIPATYESIYKYNFKLDVWVGGLLNPLTALDITKTKSLVGLDIRNIPSALYNLTPYSFLADYVSNLGAVVNNLGGWLTRLRSGYTYQTTKLVCSGTYSINNMQPLKPSSTTDYRITQNLIANNATQELLYFERIPTTLSDHIVTLQLEVPTWHQLVNTIALFKGNVQRLRV